LRDSLTRRTEAASAPYTATPMLPVRARRLLHEPIAAFWVGLSAITLAAVAIRIGHALYTAPATAGLSDAFWFHFVALNIAQGHGFVVPLGSIFSNGPTAGHPPLYPVALAAAIKLGITSDAALRSLGALFGAATVVGLGLLGRHLGGARVGLLTATIAAVDPLLIAADGALLSETLYGAVLVLALLAAWRLSERPSVSRAAAVGAAIGLATLTRAEAVLLVFLLALPLAIRGPRERRWLRAAAALGATVIVISPWVVRNWSVFGHPLLSNNEGLVVANTNCHRAYHGRDLGYLALGCEGPATGNEAQQAAHWLSRGATYASDHLGRLPVVVMVRLLRAWNLYQPFRSAWDEGRSANVQKVGIVFYYLLMLPAVIGVVILRRRRVPLTVPLAPAGLASLVAMATYGSVRLRYPGDLSVILLAGVGLMGAFEWLRSRTGASAETTGRPDLIGTR
jgi:4-amino-4-deoxy-L-arabinose transferase-like glycosyltransferase